MKMRDRTLQNDIISHNHISVMCIDYSSDDTGSISSSSSSAVSIGELLSACQEANR